MPGHLEDPPVRTSSFNVPLSTGENSRKKIDSPKNIGFRGRHAHGKAPDDPVYPTRQLAPSPRLGFVDWRTGGRALLVAAMGVLEGKLLKTRSAIMKWQMFPPCSPKCGHSCHKARNRILCSWFVPGTVHEHLVKMDGLLTMFKGAKRISQSNPPFRPMSQVAEQNKFRAVPMRWDPKESAFRQPAASAVPNPAFGINETLANENGYDSDNDPAIPIDRHTTVLTDGASLEEAKMINKSTR